MPEPEFNDLSLQLTTHTTPRALRDSAGVAGRIGLAAVLGAGCVFSLGGCADSFLDPSVAGRWEATPTIVPVLNRIAAIEEDDPGVVPASDPVAEDLLPQPSSYRITPGDVIAVTLYDLIVTDRPDTYEVLVDPRGMVDLPQLGRLQVGGMTMEQARSTIEQAMARFVRDPLAQLTVTNSRGSTYSIVGNVERSGQFLVPNSNYRLLEAITSGGRFDESVPAIFVIRRVELSDAASGTPLAPEMGGAAVPNAPGEQGPAPTGEDLINVIEGITNPGTPPKQPSPGIMPGAGAGGYVTRRQPEPPASEPGLPPPVDIVDQPAARLTTPPPESTANSWVFLNGKWVQLNAAKAAAAPRNGPVKTQDLMATRVIRIDTAELLRGNAAYNIVIRTGDVIRVPQPPSGFVYMAGQINRPGPIQLPPTGGLTLLRAIDAAGGFGSLAIPERVDLSRMLSHDRQATIRLDVRAISEQTQPDVYLKPNDRVNIGTNFWALPLAVLRNGFRANYGFSLTIDRNFGNDIFGAPPYTGPNGGE